MQFLEEESKETEEAAGLDAQEKGPPKPVGASHGTDGRIELDTASLEALQSLPRIGPDRAQAIMERRPWSNLDELQQIDGIGPRRLEAIREWAVVDKSGA